MSSPEESRLFANATNQNGRERRLRKEADSCAAPERSHVPFTLRPISQNDLNTWHATLMPNPDSLYHDHELHLRIDIPTNYPFGPPIMYFKPAIWHPNVEPDSGKVVLDDQLCWSPMVMLENWLMMLLPLIDRPDTGMPCNADAAGEYAFHRELYEQKVRKWVSAWSSQGSMLRSG